MSTILYCYSGTGNSLWVARSLAAKLKDTRIVLLNRESGFDPGEAQRIGLVFPVHIWGIPHRVREWISNLPEGDTRQWFAVAVNAGQVSATLIQLRRELRIRRIRLGMGFSVALPSNYIPWGGPGSPSDQEKRFSSAREKLGRMVPHIVKGADGPVEKGPLWQRILFSFIYRISYAKVSGMDRRFWVDRNCTACGVCARICPAGNITMGESGPEWHQCCQQCLACLQWCPEEAIQYGKKTPRYERYHHPEIQLKDLMHGKD